MKTTGVTNKTATNGRQLERGRRGLDRALLACAALIIAPATASAACGGIATAYCVSAFSQAQTPPGVTASPTTGFSFIGPGAFAVSLTDPISGKTGLSVNVTDGGEASATTGGLVTGTAGAGVSLTSNVGPARATIGAGGVLATGAGVSAVSGGIGNINITGSGVIAAGGAGVFASTGGGNVFINETGPISGSLGVSARTAGAGGLTIMTTGAVVGTAGDGVVAYTQDGLNALVVGKAGVSGSSNGAIVAATGLGGLSISLGGSITGGSAAGMVAQTVGGQIGVTVDQAATVSGATAGMIVTSTSGAASIVNNGVISSDGGAAMVATMGTGAATIGNNGLLQGATAARIASGAVAIVNNATMDGMVTTGVGATGNVNNIGTWTRAGGSTLTALQEAGTLSLGPAAGAASSVHVSGDLSIATTARWNARLTLAGADTIVVGGKTTISGGTLAVVITPGVYNIGVATPLLTSTGGVTGAFDHAYVDGGHFASLFTRAATGLSLTLGYGSLAPLAGTRNEIAVATAFDAATRTPPTGAAATLMSALYSQSGAAPLATIDQFNGDARGAAINANLAAGRMFSETIGERQEILRAGAAGGRVLSKDSDGLGVWSAGFGRVGAFAADGAQGASAQRQTTVGAALGVDYQIAAFNVGVSGGVSEGAFGAGAATGSTRGVHLGVNAGWSFRDFYATTAITTARFTNDTSRVATAPANLGAETQSGKSAARETRARFEAGWRDTSPGFHVAPFVAVEAAVLQSDGYAETLGAGGGSGLMGLSYARANTVSLPAFVGVRAEDEFNLANGIVARAKASVAWEHEFASRRDVAATLIALPAAAFTVGAARPPENAIQARLSVEARVTRAIALFASLEGEFSTTYRSVSGRGGATIAW